MGILSPLSVHYDGSFYLQMVWNAETGRYENNGFSTTHYLRWNGGYNQWELFLGAVGIWCEASQNLAETPLGNWTRMAGSGDVTTELPVVPPVEIRIYDGMFTQG